MFHVLWYFWSCFRLVCGKMWNQDGEFLLGAPQQVIKRWVGTKPQINPPLLHLHYPTTKHDHDEDGFREANHSRWKVTKCRLDIRGSFDSIGSHWDMWHVWTSRGTWGSFYKTLEVHGSYEISLPVPKLKISQSLHSFLSTKFFKGRNHLNCSD